MAAHRKPDELEILPCDRKFPPGTLCRNALALCVPGDLVSSPQGILQLALSCRNTLGSSVETGQEADRTNLAIAALARLASARFEISPHGLLSVRRGNDVGWGNRGVFVRTLWSGC